jgi:hypothetical protein
LRIRDESERQTLEDAELACERKKNEVRHNSESVRQLMGRSIQRERPGPGDDNAVRLITVPKLLTPADVAEITGLSIETLAQWRSQKRGIQYVKVSRNCVRYRHIDLDTWLAEHIVRVEVDPNAIRRT